MSIQIEGKFRIRRIEKGGRAVYYGLYNTKWDALRGCIAKAERFSLGCDFEIYPALSYGGELIGLTVAVEFDCTTFVVVEAH